MGALAIDDAVNMLDRARDRFVEQLRSVPDGTVKIPHLTWTIAETAAHVLSALRGYHDMALGGPPMWPDLINGPAHNARLITQVPEREPHEMSYAIDLAAEALVDVWHQNVTGRVPWHSGLTIPTASEAALLANDVLIHGWDVAKALRRPWSITEPDSIMAFRAYCDVLPALVNRSHAHGFAATGEVHLRGGPYISMYFARTKLTMAEERTHRADFRISAVPTAYNLSTFGRISPLIAMLRGAIVVYGRKPWLAPKMGKLFYEA